MTPKDKTIRVAYLLPDPITYILLGLSKKGDDPKDWPVFLKEKYDGGAKKVTNPNPDSKDTHPEVSTSTALKNPEFRGRLQKEFEDWIADTKEETGKEEGEKTSKFVNSSVKRSVTPEKKPIPFVDTDNEEEVQKIASDFSARESWDDGDKSSIRIYTGGSFESINELLRGHLNTPEYTDQDRVDIRKLVKKMDKVFKKKESKTKRELSVVRGISSEHPLFKSLMGGSLELGTTFEEKGYSSTSINGKLNWGAITLHISVPQGSSAVYVGPPPAEKKYSQYPKEYEVLLNRGTKFKVTGWDKTEGSNHTIHLEVVND